MEINGHRVAQSPLKLKLKHQVGIVKWKYNYFILIMYDSPSNAFKTKVQYKSLDTPIISFH